MWRRPVSRPWRRRRPRTERWTQARERPAALAACAHCGGARCGFLRWVFWVPCGVSGTWEREHSSGAVTRTGGTARLRMTLICVLAVFDEKKLVEGCDRSGPRRGRRYGRSRECTRKPRNKSQRDRFCTRHQISATPPNACCAGIWPVQPVGGSAWSEPAVLSDHALSGPLGVQSDQNLRF